MDAISDMTNVAEHMYAKLLATYGHCQGFIWYGVEVGVAAYYWQFREL